jgi:Tol biopolymer transport system component/predicted Ser/Thr protein kinase
MPLARGDKLGPYEILEPIGKGGMGEVWKAHDPRVGRDVAIKVSAAQFSDRFEREARVIAQLNHPNICTLYDVGPNYLVMEYIEGPTLAERIKEGAVPLEETLGVASQIAAALEEAHDKGVVHRDLKPGNVKIRPGGIVKVLDFGLAKLGATNVASASPGVGENSPTLTMGMTEAGMILGTASYMAPEQAKGKPVDKRADIWAFGVVVYEMLTGDRLFKAADVADTLAAVLRQEIDYEAVPAQTRLLLRRCLEREPLKRLRDIADAMPMVAGVPAPVTATAPVFAPSQTRLGNTMPWAVAGIVTLALAVLAILHFREKSLEAPVVRTSILPPEEASGFVLDANTGGTAISPDGRLLAFVANVRGKSSLFVRPLDSLTARALPGTEGASRPFWSPDSRNIGFHANSKLQRIGVNEGAPRVICDLTSARGATWNADGVIVFFLRSNQALNRVPASGGAPQQITTLNPKTERFHYWPQFLPDGRHFLYLIRAEPLDKSAIYVGSLDDKPDEEKRVKLVDSQLGAIFAPNPLTPGKGQLLWVQGQSLMAQAFDPETLKLNGEAVPVAESIGATESDGYADLSASNTGVLAYGNSRQSLDRLTWIDRAGKRSEPLPGTGGGIVRISPDGNSVMTFRLSPATDLWRIDLLRNTETRLTFSGGQAPVWSPDGAEVVFSTPAGLFRKPASGAGEPAELLKVTSTVLPYDWSDDGKWLLWRQTFNTGQELWAAPMEVGGKIGKPFLFVNAPGQARFSPGVTGQRWVAYVSGESGQGQVYIQDFPDKHGKWQVSAATGGVLPVWNRNGRELFYESLGNKMMAVSVKANGTAVTLGQPEPLFDLPARTGYDVSPDGKRFLVALPQDQDRRQDSITLVENWQWPLGR